MEKFSMRYGPVVIGYMELIVGSFPSPVFLLITGSSYEFCKKNIPKR